MPNNDIAFAVLKECVMQWSEWYHPYFCDENNGAPSESEAAILKKVEQALGNISSNSYCLKRLQDWELCASLCRCTEIARLIKRKCNQIERDMGNGNPPD